MWHIGSEHVLKLNNVRGGRDVVEVKRGNSIDVLEDSGKLSSHSLDLSLTEAKTGQFRYVQDLLSLDHGG